MIHFFPSVTGILGKINKSSPMKKELNLGYRFDSDFLFPSISAPLTEKVHLSCFLIVLLKIMYCDPDVLHVVPAASCVN